MIVMLYIGINNVIVRVDMKYTLHNCPHCDCFTGEEIREQMRYNGHTCIWSSEYLYNKNKGYLDYNCQKCEEERKIK